ncbi:hypothetical protein B0H16DRAFT_1604769 [Mycena metata]|uniref:Uncharacterized protein n=1 Tax=Mycena metata TaxID=1033252 RepID=A0AAD7HGL2_9AGAR|nr:hypothetical protein B0H16DRAFT_1604769 [Mycena metata]
MSLLLPFASTPCIAAGLIPPSAARVRTASAPHQRSPRCSRAAQAQHTPSRLGLLVLDVEVSGPISRAHHSARGRPNTRTAQGCPLPTCVDSASRCAGTRTLPADPEDDELSPRLRRWGWKPAR